MILGELARDGRPTARDPAAALGGDATTRELGPLRVAWRGRVDAHEDGALLVLVDGFLLGATSDAAALAAAWESRGAGVVHDLRGAFTVLIWDGARRRGLIAGDHFASRVCLLHESGDRLRFTTHLPALIRFLPNAPAPDPRVIVPWIAPRYLQGRETMAAGVERLGGASLVELGADGWRRRRYWEPRYTGEKDVPRSELPALVRGALDAAVARRLPAVGEAGVILSGGLDSSAVAAVAAEERPGALRSYSTVFPDWPAADESGRIAATTRGLGIRGTRATLRPQGALRLALEYLRASGSVPGGPGLLVERPLLEQAAADDVRVILDGQGGDEVFGNSPYLIADRIRSGDLRGIGRLLTHVPDMGRRRPSRTVLRSLLVDFGLKPALGDRIPAAWRTTGDLPLPDWLAPGARAVFDSAHDPWPWMRPGLPLWWSYAAYLVTRGREGSALGEYTWVRGADLGVESRTPLFDVELTELMLSLAPEASWGPINRPLARAAVAGSLPDEVRLNRRKANIGPFYLDVLTGPDLHVIRVLLLDPAARVREWVLREPYERAIRRTPTLSDPDWLGWITVVWRLATAECWLRWLEDSAWVDELLDAPSLPRMSATVAN